MRELLSVLDAALADGRPVGYCRLVETRGSTPQKPGAAMLVFADGSQAGTLGGGCVEAEVKRRALEVLERGDAEMVRFTLDNDYGWDDGLICGGRMQVLIDPLRNQAAAGYYRQLHQLANSGRGFLEAIAFDAEKSGLPETACWLLDELGALAASLRAGQHGDMLPASLRASIPDFSRRPRPSHAHGVALLPSLPRCRLLIVGGGHIGQSVGSMAPELDFEVWVVDDRAEYVSRERFPRAERLLRGEIGKVLAEVEITPHTYCLIVTRGHNHDEEALYHLADRGARYVGMIGSRRKIKLIFDDLLAEGFSSDVLERVYAPVGLQIGSQTVPEIAVSILAELVAHRNLDGQVPGRAAADIGAIAP